MEAWEWALVVPLEEWAWVALAVPMVEWVAMVEALVDLLVEDLEVDLVDAMVASEDLEA